mmetsp:Transcript_84155/g.234640  ORF Transcript_84155/g.234640 Transcript_84155/m.234640 type:complete len:232 (+) Transcript_84155:26-721(+)
MRCAMVELVQISELILCLTLQDMDPSYARAGRACTAVKAHQRGRHEFVKTSICATWRLANRAHSSAATSSATVAASYVAAAASSASSAATSAPSSASSAASLASRAFAASCCTVVKSPSSAVLSAAACISSASGLASSATFSAFSGASPALTTASSALTAASSALTMTSSSATSFASGLAWTVWTFASWATSLAPAPQPMLKESRPLRVRWNLQNRGKKPKVGYLRGDAGT